LHPDFIFEETSMSLMKSFALLAGRVLGGAALIAASFSAGAADPFPAREIHFIVPWNAGGSNDISARTLARRSQRRTA
jgi:tripartite-type tricarboxylate transporter receptor subunit TctC